MKNDDLDLEMLADLKATFGPRVVRLVERFEGLLPDYLQALETSDPEEFRRAAHTLKSAAGALGLRALAHRAKDLEQGGPASFTDLAPLAEENRAALKDWLSESGGDASEAGSEDRPSGTAC